MKFTFMCEMTRCWNCQKYRKILRNVWGWVRVWRNAFLGTTFRFLAKRNGTGQSQRNGIRNGTAFQVLVEREEQEIMSTFFVKIGWNWVKFFKTWFWTRRLFKPRDNFTKINFIIHLRYFIWFMYGIANHKLVRDFFFEFEIYENILCI